jgi:hypothetical protein
MNNDQQHETVADAARRDRLDAVMTTRAARWCAEQVDDCATRGLDASRHATAHHLAAAWGHSLINAVYKLGHDPADPHLVTEAWQHRALMAWSHLVVVAVRVEQSCGDVVDPFWDETMAELEAADAAVTWQLASERIAR